MNNIRKNVFETNSSSTHSICITKENKYISIPDEIKINIKDYTFGWEYDKRITLEEKLAYIIIGITSLSYSIGLLEALKKMETILEMIGKWVESVHIEGIDFISYNNKSYLDAHDGYVDHGNELHELIEALLLDEELFKRYLFSKDSFILTGNDNSWGYPSINENYEYDEFYKGN